MRPAIALPLAVVLILAAVLPVPVSGGIVVRPGGDFQPPPSAVGTEPVEITVWELPAGILLSVIAESAAGLFFTVKLWAALGYRRVEKGNVLLHETRLRILSCIRENPGIHYHALARRTGISLSTLRHHIGILLRTGTIAASSGNHRIRYFENSGTSSKTERLLLGHIRNETTRGILTAIAEVPGIGRNGIARRLGITGAAVTWHIRRLEHDGIVCQVSTEKTVRYVIPGEILACLSRGTLPAAGQVQEEPAAQAPAS